MKKVIQRNFTNHTMNQFPTPEHPGRTDGTKKDRNRKQWDSKPGLAEMCSWFLFLLLSIASSHKEAFDSP
jgi:hypothetical protein